MYAIVRLRGQVNIKPEIKYTLELLRLPRVNHCVVVEENGYYAGMIQKVKDYVAWGEISEDMVALLLRRRGRIEGGGRLTDEYIRSKTSFADLQELAHALIEGQMNPKDLSLLQIKPVFRLHPPRRGHKGIKRSVKQGGELGYHGETINELLFKMR
ncbi:MAG: 50S ribosomal protein L30 [Methanophagales archaeon ANME-1-THS]|nr:MAG: 50S ribosomal protein L30 [Methanophagales archaeon ANME-1-THS]